MKPKLILFFLLLALISACSKNPNKTDAKIKISLGALLDVNQYAQSGAMLWGKNDKGDMFGEVLDGSDLSLELNNGQWTFWAIAWDGSTPGEAFTGTSRCAKTTSQLTGGDVQLNINLYNSTCNSADFSPANSISDSGKNVFPNISFYDCDKLSDHNGFGCGNNINNAKGSSRRLMMVGFRKTAGSNFERVGNALVSKCYTGDFSSEHLPLGNGHVPFYTVVQSFFSSSSCDETDPKGFYKDVFELGLVGTSKGTAISNVNSGLCNYSSFNTRIQCEKLNGSWNPSTNMCSSTTVGQQRNVSEYICINNGGSYTPDNTKTLSLITSIPQAIFCSGKRVDPSNSSPHVFAGGSGSILDPYKICTEFQLNQIRQNYPSNHFLLSSDLDMNRTSILGDQPKADCHVSEFGQNYNPIGGLYDASCAPSVLVAFRGSFNGNNYQISNIRMSANANLLGFIREGGKISNLTLKNISVEGSGYVGAFSGAGATALSNLLVIEGDIRGDDFVGGIVGDFSEPGVILNHLHAKKTRIELTSAPGRMGGLVGFSSASVLQLVKSSFEGTIHLKRPDPTSYIGGLVGSLSYGVNISESFSNGSIITYGNAYVGGLVGKAGSSSYISNSYSLMNMGPSNHNAVTSGSFGGFFGHNNASLNLNNSFFYGSIMHNCRKGSSSACSVMGFSGGGGAITPVSSYSAFLAKEWYTTQPSNLVTTTILEGYKSSFAAATGNPFIDVGGSSPTVKLHWQDDTCSKFSNNQPVSVQQLARGNTDNPIIICHASQLKEIKNYPTLNYELGQDITVGLINNDSRIAEFSGSLDGKGFNIGGLLDLESTTLKGFIQTNKGKISNINFVNSSMHNSSNEINDAGIVALNDVGGIISDNHFQSVSIFEGKAKKQGVIAGENRGHIVRNKISSDVNATNTAGIAVGSNSSSGVIKGLGVNGMLTLLAPDLTSSFGGVVGLNFGKISETTTNASVINPESTGQYLSTSFIGAFIGSNNGFVEDVLVSHHARLESAIVGSKHGQVFGRTSSNSVIKRLIAANEVAKPSSFAVDVKSFTNESAGSYLNSFIMDGSVFEYLTSARTIVNCNNAVTGINYLLSGFNFSTYTDGIFVKDVNHDYITRRISNGSVLVNSNNLIDPNSGHFTIPCESNGVQPGKAAYEIKTITNFSHPEISALNPLGIKNLITYCASSNGTSLAEKPDATCNLLNDEFDVVEDKTNGFGSNRLISAYKAFFNSNTLPENKPVWVFNEDDPYPKLFLAD